MDNFTKRDTAVIPWLPQYSRPSVAKPKRPCKIISLLGARERIGLKSNCTRTGSLSEGILVSNEELSGAGAWNRRRMQNMILAVGPGTPASCVLTSVGTAGTGNDSDSNDEDDIYQVDTDDDGEIEMLESDDEDENLEDEGNNDVMIANDEDMLSDGSSELEIVAEVTDTAQDVQEEKSYNDRLEAEAEIARHLAARPIEEQETQRCLVQRCDDKESRRRSAWTHDQENIPRQPPHGDESDIEIDENEESYVSNHHIDSGNEISSNESVSDESMAQQRAVQVRDFLDRQIRRQIRRRHRSQHSSDYPTSDNSQSSHYYEREVARSMKHNGCINTVSWLDCGWRISTVSHEDVHPYNEYYNDIFVSSSYSSNVYFSTPMRYKQSDGLAVPTNGSEYPTQLITSGDDHVVKFWDVSCAMGSTSPLPGGSATVAPFCSAKVPMKPTSELISKWKSHVWPTEDDHDDIAMKYKQHLPGIVHPLLSLATGHRGNVFDAKAIPNSPGKLLTCAADGTVRMTDVHINATSSPAARNRGRSNSTSSASIAAEASTTIISPEFHSENEELRFRDSLMCFSQHFLNDTVGLVCSERGLLHFDLRLPPSSQKRGSMIEELSATCKSCCVWKQYNEDSDSVYVFAGGSGADVGLYDLRMTGRPSSQAVQKYRPKPLRRKSTVSISGIEVSRDKKELLVAYESDQCYTFPIFPKTASPAGPTLSDINASTEDLSNGAKPISELAQYGAHLNRLTFLKTAKYAGANDQYICTGSDSGHAWIYDKATGSVAAFLRADNSTCNGILPHPSLPYFVTYGIDSTAKLWRATLPVDDELDDSDSGRFAYTRTERYKKSVIADKWRAARKGKHVDLDSEDIPFLPDETPEESGLEDSFPLGFMGLLFSRTQSGSGPVYIGNDLMSLSNEMKKNFYTCARVGLGEDVAVKSSLAGLKTRMSLIKLRHHADRLGLQWDCNVPWNMSFVNRVHDTAMKEEKSNVFADLIPDPSDWMPFNSLMANPPLDYGQKNFYDESYPDVSSHPVKRAIIPNHNQTMLQEEIRPRVQFNLDNNVLDEDDSFIEYDSTRNWDILYSTIALLKEAGNTALKQSLNCLAASYYDKAMLYCSLPYMDFPVGNIEFLAQHQVALSENSGWECRWTPMLKIFLQIRLNMSLCLLKSDVNDIKGAVFQAKMALKELKPFIAHKGRVMTGKKLNRSRLEEPETTYNEAIALQAKAYFRLGSGQLLLSDFEDAIESFQCSIKSSSESDPEKKPDSTVLRKLQEAQLANKRHCNCERKKFKFAFASKDHEHLQ